MKLYEKFINFLKIHFNLKWHFLRPYNHFPVKKTFIIMKKKIMKVKRLYQFVDFEDMISHV